MAAGGERHAAILSDAHATILDVVGDEQSISGPEQVPGPGALLSEAACGANGIGTALAERGYVELVGPEHFILGFRRFTCQGIPIHGETGAITGVLSVSVRRPIAGQRLREILFCTAHAVEMELQAERLEEHLRGAISARNAGAEHLERLLEDVLQAQPSVRLRLALAAERLAQHEVAYARALLDLAAGALGRFHRHACLWRALALDERAAPCALALDAALAEIVEMLEVEATTRGVTLVHHDIEPVVVEADPNALARALFRGVLSAMEAARGGDVHIDLRRVRGGGELCLTPRPGLGVADAAPAPVRLTVPLRSPLE